MPWFVAECLHFFDVEGIPINSADELPSFYQAVSSLILQNEVTHIAGYKLIFCVCNKCGISDCLLISVICEVLMHFVVRNSNADFPVVTQYFMHCSFE